MNRLIVTTIWLSNLAIPLLCRAQAINVDLDSGIGAWYTGNGAPSDQFPGAADQPGRWNRIYGNDPGPFVLEDVTGSVTSAIYTSQASGFSGGYAFLQNTGDYALLLNDATMVGTVIQGGHAVFAFSGLIAGTYDIFTYATNIAGYHVPVPVEIPEAIGQNIQVVEGGMTGNSFAYLVTHAIHRVSLSTGGSFNVVIDRPPGTGEHDFCINGFQIKPVPETEPCLVITVLVSASAIRGSRART